MDFHKWPSIEAFRSVAHNSASRFVVPYRGKIKLHGTNAAIQFDGDVVAAQSRSRLITPDDDNLGFAVTEARLRQALFEVCSNLPVMQKTGDFLKWVQSDIQKECAEELAAFEDQKKILGLCGARAVQWFKVQCSA